MKLYYFICTAILLSSLSVYGQERELEFGVSYYLNHSLSVPINDGSVLEEIEIEYIENQAMKPSFSSDLFFEYGVKEKLKLGLSIGYQNTGARDKITDSSFYFGNYELIRMWTNHNIQLSHYLKYYLADRFYVQPGLSLAANVINTNTEIYVWDDDIDFREPIEITVRSLENEDYRDLYLSILMGIGLDVYRSERVSLFLQPNLQYMFSGKKIPDTLQKHLFSYGITLGFRV